MKYRFLLVVVFTIIGLGKTFMASGQPKQLLFQIDSLKIHVLNHHLDSSLTKESKPEPLIFVDGYLFDKNKLKGLKDEDIKSVKAVSDSLTFQLFDKNAWGGIIIIETKLSKRKLKKIL